MSDFDSLIKKVNEIIDLVKADPATKLPGVLINKAAPAPAPAPAPVQKPMTVAGAPKPPTPPGMKAPGMKKDAMGSFGGGAMNMNMDKAVQQPQGKPGHSTIGTIVRTAMHMKQHGFPKDAKQHMGLAVQEQRNEAHRTMQEPKPNLPKSEGRDPAHLAKWMQKAVGCMKMCKNDMERQRITDGVVANERRKDSEAAQRQEHEDQVSEHQKAANAYKEDKIDQDKGREVVNPANKSLIPQVVNKAEPLMKPYKSDAQRKWAHTEAGTKALGGKAAVHHWDEETKGKKLPEHVAKASESKHDRCVEHVKENSPEVKNPHAVCVAEGVKPAKWGKGEEMDKALGGTGAPSTPTPRPDAGFGAVVVKDQKGVHPEIPMGEAHQVLRVNPKGVSPAGAATRAAQVPELKNQYTQKAHAMHTKILSTLKGMKKPNLP